MNVYVTLRQGFSTGHSWVHFVSMCSYCKAKTSNVYCVMHCMRGSNLSVYMYNVHQAKCSDSSTSTYIVACPITELLRPVPFAKIDI